MKTSKTNHFLDLELCPASEIYYTTVCGRTVFVHPKLVQNDEIAFPIKSCKVLEIDYFKEIVVLPGDYILHYFDTNGGEIEDVWKDYISHYYARNKDGVPTQMLILGYRDGVININWKDKYGKRWETTLDNKTGQVKTVENA